MVRSLILSLRLALFCWLLVTPVVPAKEGETAGLPSGTGLLLPIQDRVGEPEVASLAELVFRNEVSKARQFSSPANLRDTLRQLRIRDIEKSTPQELERLAAVLGVDWFLTITLHEAGENPLPLVTLSAQLLRPGDQHLFWSGFISASGLDTETLFGIGRVENLDQLVRLTTGRLAEGIAAPRRRRAPRPRLGWTKKSFLRRPLSPEPPARLAVVPFYSVTQRAPGLAAEMGTKSALAVLHEAGYDVALPGAVHEVFRRTGRLHVGQIDRPARIALRNELEVTAIFTGTVETYRLGTGLRADPWVAVGAHLIDTEDGRIDWIGGADRRGSKSDSVFEVGRIHSAATLVHEITRSLIATFTNGNGLT